MSATFGSSTGAVSLGSVRDHKHVASQISGPLPQSSLPDVAASQFESVTGKNLTIMQIPRSIGAKFTTGTFTDAQLFDNSGQTIPHGKIGDGNLPWARISGAMTSAPSGNYWEHIGNAIHGHVGGYMFASIRAYHTNGQPTYPGSQLSRTAYYRTGETRLLTLRAGHDWGASSSGTWRIFADHDFYWHGGDSNPTWLSVLALRIA